MIYRLRVKFVVINMTIVVLMMSVVFGLVYHFTRADLEEKSIRMMEKIANRPFQIEMPGEQSEQIRLPFFILHLGTGGELIASSGGYFDLSDQEFLMDLIVRARSSHQKVGVIKEYGFRYYKTNTPYRYSLVFADISSETAALKGLVRTCALIAGLSFILFLAISIWLSGWAVRPVEKAWKQQRQFVADASHELKTPLTVILANTGLVLSHPEDTVAAQSKWLEYTHDEAEQMKELVDDLLFLAKSDAARQPAARAETAMSEVALGCLLPFESVAFEAGVALKHRITPGLSLRGDEGQLRRLVMILLDNAVKYAGPGGTVTFTLERHQERLRLAVHNTGEPIPPEHLPHLFERFYRADAARNRSGGGYGLGLAIARSIVEGHHGRLTVTSTAAAGTTFTALLPRR